MLANRIHLPRTSHSASPRFFQRGYLLIEGLISILIFSVGILAIFGLQAASIKNSSDAKYRADASFLANQIVGYMWGDRGNLAAYAHYASGSACSPSGTASTNSNVTGWLTEVGTSLPGAVTTKQQIIVNTNTVTVTVCWKSPQDSGYHPYTAIAQING